MKYAHALLVPVVTLLMVGTSHAQIFRCPGNAYTNNATEAKSKGCKAIEGGNVTVVEGTRVNGASGNTTVKVASASSNAPKTTTAEQGARDTDMRTILDAELKKAEAKQVELQKEYNNGEPDKQGIEGRNHQRYLDRVAELKASIARNESDIAGIKRELGRVPAK